MDYFILPDGTISAGDNEGNYPLAPERPSFNHIWDTSLQNWIINPQSVIEEFNNAIRAAQNAFGANPLPVDLRREVYDLARDMPVYIALGDYDLVHSIATNFSIDPNRIGVDVTQEQYDLVAAIKYQMLTLIESLQNMQISEE